MKPNTSTLASDLRISLPAGGMLFCFLCGYFLLRPLRETFGIRDPDELPWLYLCTMATTVLVVYPAFAWLSSRTRRSLFVPAAYLFGAATLVLFALAHRFGGAYFEPWVARGFYVFISSYNIFGMSVFYGFLADSVRLDRSKRTYGWISVGGTLGALSASWVVMTRTHAWSPFWQMLAGAAIIAMSALFVPLLERAIPVAEPQSGTPSGGRARPLGGTVLTGLKPVARSGYMQLVAVYVLMMTVSNTFIYFVQARLIDASFSTPETQSAAFASINFWTQLTTLVLQGLLTRVMLVRAGVGFTLGVLPVATVAALAALAAWPTFGVLVCCVAGHTALRYSFARSSRETLFTVVDRETKYKTKSFIDTFVYRLGDVVGSQLDSGLGAVAQSLKIVGAAAGATALLALPFAGVWVAVAAALGVALRRRAGSSEESSTPDETGRPRAG